MSRGNLDLTAGPAAVHQRAAKPMTVRQPAAADEPASGRGWPGVTVVVATRDRPEPLARALRSILDQDYPGQIECLVVNDQSDPPPLPEERRANRSLRSLPNNRTPGLPGSRNSGILVATGELIAFCDDDDEWLPGKLRRQVELARSEPDAAFVACGVYVRYRGRDTRRLAPRRPLTHRDLLHHRWLAVHPSTLLASRDMLLDRIGLVDEEVPGGYGEDYEWLLRATRIGTVVSVPEPLVVVNWHSHSFFAGHWRTLMTSQRYLLERYPEFRTERAGMARMQGGIALAHAALGERRAARRWAVRALRHQPWEHRAYAALLVSSGLVRVDTLLRIAHLAGRGI